jgi:hypothetical protein
MRNRPVALQEHITPAKSDDPIQHDFEVGRGVPDPVDRDKVGPSAATARFRSDLKAGRSKWLRSTERLVASARRSMPGAQSKS